jgi:deazaflavin-dependent oxidoreductase (nitroreductase family)
MGEMEDDLVAWGRVARIETRGRRTGRPIPVVVGFVERANGSIVVAATAPQAAWALNLEADAHCRVTIGDDTWDAVGRRLVGPEHAAAVRDLILRYGTPSEGLGSGPSFELAPLHASDGGSASAG